LEEKVPAVAGAFFSLFRAILRVVSEKGAFLSWFICGESVVDSW